MIVVAGLGNPGEKYSQTRHNVGFMITGKLAQSNSINGKSESKFNAIIGKGNISGVDILIVQPLTYMNLSGESIAKILNFYKVPIENLFVVYDDISLDLGKIRFRKEGSAGGHNGIKSTINCLGQRKDFSRLKVGIGPQPPKMPSEAFVLQKFAKEEEQLLEKTVETSVKAIEYYLKHGVDKAQNTYNGIDLSKS